MLKQRESAKRIFATLYLSLGIPGRSRKEERHYAMKWSIADWVTSRFYFGVCYWLLKLFRKCETKVRHWLNLLVSWKRLTLTWTSTAVETVLPRFLAVLANCPDLSLPSIITIIIIIIISIAHNHRWHRGESDDGSMRSFGHGSQCTIAWPWKFRETFVVRFVRHSVIYLYYIAIRQR